MPKYLPLTQMMKISERASPPQALKPLLKRLRVHFVGNIFGETKYRFLAVRSYFSSCSAQSSAQKGAVYK